MRDEFKIKRQGKEYVLFAGLLDEAHTRFSRLAIETELLEMEPIPVIRARFKGWKGDGLGADPDVITSGIGTGARETDTKGPGKDAPVEMAETRAKARALRDAVNVGATSLEELPDEDGANTTPQPTSRPKPQGRNKGSTSRQDPNPTTTTTHDTNSHLPDVPEEATSKQEAALQATRQQVSTLNNLMGIRSKQTGQSQKEIKDGFVDFIGFPIKDLSRGEAAKYIRSFEKKIEEHVEEEEAS